MTSILPPIPRFIFTIFEPVALVAGFVAPIMDTEGFISSQIPSAVPNPVLFAPTSQVLALQLGNVYGLLAMVGIAVLYTTSEPKVVRNFLIACAVADVGHLYVTYFVMGYEHFTDILHWNSMGWGNIGVTAGLLICRVLYLIGALGTDRLVGNVQYKRT